MRNDPLPIRIGGLYRCCIRTYQELAPSANETSEGDTLSCSYCDDAMIVRDGEWQWIGVGPDVR